MPEVTTALGRIVKFEVKQVFTQDIRDTERYVLVNGKNETCIVEIDDRIKPGVTVTLNMRGAFTNVLEVKPAK